MKNTIKLVIIILPFTFLRCDKPIDKNDSEKWKAEIIQAEKALLEQSLAEKQGRLSVVTRLLHTEDPVAAEQALWQQLDVKAGWEQAVEWVFDGLLKMPTLVGAHQEGFTLHPVYKDEVVQAKVNLSPWLSHVHWINDKAAALNLLPELSSDDMMVTADGFIIGQGFVRLFFLTYFLKLYRTMNRTFLNEFLLITIRLLAW